MSRIDASLFDKLPLGDITKVTFYKRDLLTADLICCDVEKDGDIWTFHEELAGWDTLIEHLQMLPDFRNDWFGAVSQPSFITNEAVAFSR